MLRWIGLLLLCLTVPAATGTARAALLTPIPQPAGAQCRPAIDAAERGTAIPPHLLAAIGRVESGRRDPQSGGWNPWPWTVNAEGEGFFFDTKEQAIAAVRTMQARGTRSIDVGCMQVNLMHHPDAFGSLEQAFDPASNAAYARGSSANCTARATIGSRRPPRIIQQPRNWAPNTNGKWSRHGRKRAGLQLPPQYRRWPLRGVPRCTAAW
jgi:hypothetical protein